MWNDEWKSLNTQFRVWMQQARVYERLFSLDVSIAIRSASARNCSFNTNGGVFPIYRLFAIEDQNAVISEGDFLGLPRGGVAVMHVLPLEGWIVVIGWDPSVCLSAKEALI